MHHFFQQLIDAPEDRPVQASVFQLASSGSSQGGTKPVLQDFEKAADASLVLERQVGAVERLIPGTMLANAVFASAVTFICYKNGPMLLLWWLGTVVAVSLLRSLASSRRLKTLDIVVKQATFLSKYKAEAIGLGILNASAPAWLLSHSPSTMFALLICHLTGLLWAGSLLLTTLFAINVWYVATCLFIVALGLLVPASAPAGQVFIVIMFCSAGGVLLFNAKMQSSLFRSSELRKLDLKRQGELIGVLLKDFEEQANDWFWETDRNLQFRNPSDRFAEALSMPLTQLASKRIETLFLRRELSCENEQIVVLLDCLRALRSFRDIVVPLDINGSTQWWSFSGRPQIDALGKPDGYRGVVSNVTSQHQARAREVFLAHHDPLTRLPNRASFSAKVHEALSRVGERGIAILSLDLDGFKSVNDRCGHPGGDTVLSAMADRLRLALPPTCILSRFGGDEFLVLVDEAPDHDRISALCIALITEAAAPAMVGGHLVKLGASIGVSIAPFHGSNPGDLIRNADAALYRAKAEGRGTFCFFHSEMDEKLRNQQHLKQELQLAAVLGQLSLYLQPFVNAISGEVTGYEALVRWIHPLRGVVSPVDFIPLAEESGAILEIGRWVLAEACHAAARLPANQRVSVNISPLQLREVDLAKIVADSLTEAKLSPGKLELEVTETVFIHDAEKALQILRQVRRLGVRIALDDFGTGYSSLSYLSSFPFDKVKIDRSFVQGLETSRENQIIVRAIRDLAKGLGMTITAEGVETSEQAHRLRALGCEELQGFLYGRPEPQPTVPTSAREKTRLLPAA